MKHMGIMGGTFNPVHYGHLMAAEIVKEQLKLDNVIFIPTGNPPHKLKTEVLDSHHRINMLKLAIDNNEGFTISEIETDREGKTYTYDTLEKLHNQYYGNHFYFIIGYDTLKELGTWRNIELVARQCCFVVVNRDNSKQEMNDTLEAARAKFHIDAVVVNIPNIELSSSEIRARVKCGQSIRYMVPDPVIDYMEENRLYKEPVAD